MSVGFVDDSVRLRIVLVNEGIRFNLRRRLLEFLYG